MSSVYKISIGSGPESVPWNSSAWSEGDITEGQRWCKKLQCVFGACPQLSAWCRHVGLMLPRDGKASAGYCTSAGYCCCDSSRESKASGVGRIIESWNHEGWKRMLWSPSPTPAHLIVPTDHIHQCHNSMALEHSRDDDPTTPWAGWPTVTDLMEKNVSQDQHLWPHFKYKHNSRHTCFVEEDAVECAGAGMPRKELRAPHFGQEVFLQHWQNCWGPFLEVQIHLSFSWTVLSSQTEQKSLPCCQVCSAVWEME